MIVAEYFTHERDWNHLAKIEIYKQKCPYYHDKRLAFRAWHTGAIESKLALKARYLLLELLFLFSESFLLNMLYLAILIIGNIERKCL